MLSINVLNRRVNSHHAVVHIYNNESLHLTLVLMIEKIDQVSNRSNVIVEKHTLILNHQVFIGITAVCLFLNWYILIILVNINLNLHLCRHPHLTLFPFFQSTVSCDKKRNKILYRCMVFFSFLFSILCIVYFGCILSRYNTSTLRTEEKEKKSHAQCTYKTIE
jgi:hypothetical protein